MYVTVFNSSATCAATFRFRGVGVNINPLPPHLTVAAIRAGDYYLFEEGTDELLDKDLETQTTPSSLTFGSKEDKGGEKRMGPLQVGVNTVSWLVCCWCGWLSERLAH